MMAAILILAAANDKPRQIISARENMGSPPAKRCTRGVTRRTTRSPTTRMKTVNPIAMPVTVAIWT